MFHLEKSLKHTLLFVGMKKIFLFVFLIQSYFAFAQKIANVHSEQDGNNINIYYDLLSKKNNQNFNISVYCSTDGGKTYGNALIGVSGDIGKNIVPGKNKKIVWNVFQDMNNLNGDIVFNVKAEVIIFGIKDSLISIKEIKKRKTLISTSASFNATGGLMIGRIGKTGYYMSCRYNINPAGYKTSTLVCDTASITNYDKTDEYYKFTNRVARPRFSLCGGITYQFAKKFHAYTGLGYGISNLFWEIEEYKYTETSGTTGKRWVAYNGWEKKGLEWEIGALFNYKWFALHVGFTTLSFSRSSLTLGIGVAF